MSEIIETDVIIVGGGLTGLMLSCILGKSGIENIVLEKSTTTNDWPEANYINPRSMELIRHRGLDQYICENAMPENFMVANSVSLMKEPLQELKFFEELIKKGSAKDDGVAEKVLQEISSQKPCVISQTQTKKALKKAAEELPSCSIRYGWEVMSISQDEDDVQVEVVIAESRVKKTIEARFLVGCDGAQSMVRKSLGINYTGDFAVGKFRSVFFKSRELRKHLYNPKFMAYLINKYNCRCIVLPVDTEQLFMVHIIITSDESDETMEKPSEYYIKSILDNSENIPFEVLQDRSWKADIVHAENFQRERVFLAGDAAHLVTPVDGIGMNSGIGDAFNIGWKLVATVQGWGGEWLLDSYASESLPLHKKVNAVNRERFRLIKLSSKMAIFFMTSAPFKYIFRAINKFTTRTVESEGLTYGIMLRNSPVCVPSGLQTAIEDREYYVGEAYAACRAPHFRFQDGSSLHSKLGEMFTLLCLSPCDESRKFLVKYAKEAGLPLKVLEFDNEILRTLYKAKMALIRPDLCIAWSGDEIPALSNDNSLRTRARVLINVVTGATPLPPEWAWERVIKIPTNPKPVKSNNFWLIPVCSILIGVMAFVVYSATQ